MLKVPPKCLTKFLLELHDILSNQSGLVNRVDFLQENSDEIIPRIDSIKC